VRIVPLARYEKHIKRLLSSNERMAMESNIAAQPLSYPVMPQAGGCRKARWARGNRGRSSGIRVVFYYHVQSETVYMIDAYPKNEKENLTDAEKSDLKRLSKAIEQEGV
jgi:mRNA-degrading endonuclease RelE of RelBE toxin-antitoxin system